MIKTTCIGAYPKPDFVDLPDWFNGVDGTDTSHPTREWAQAMATMGANADDVVQRGVAQVLADQESAKIDIPTDGEVPRENYIHYHCRHLDGIDFSNLTEKSLRNGAYSAQLPTIVSAVKSINHFLVRDWQRAQKLTERPVKITMPGPMTIGDTTVDAFYGDPKKRGADLADALNKEVIALANEGCQHIQIDEPLFARNPADALDFGFENLERAFYKAPRTVTRTVHMCCGYPDRLDSVEYPKADPESYALLAGSIEDSCIDAVSLEDAHRQNDLSLLNSFNQTTVILGVIAIASSKIETVDEIEERLRLVLNHIDSDRLIAAPDCGLGLLGRSLALQKLSNLGQAAKRV